MSSEQKIQNQTEEKFSQFELPLNLLGTLKKLQFYHPTLIQSKVIPIVLQRKDVLASSQTGTGKTGAFGIPIVAQLLKNQEEGALVITPTRELATQVMKLIYRLIPAQSKIKTALLIGGCSILRQVNQLKKRPSIIVGTPGRMNDLIERKVLKLKHIKTLVLDETDRMLDMGFSIQINEILKHMPQKKQTLLFSATLPKNILNLTKKYLNDEERVAIGSSSKPIESVNQKMLVVSEKNKYEVLTDQLDQREGAVIIFVKTKYGTEKLAKRLKGNQFQAQAIHGDLRHNKRERVIQGFRDKKYRILVATDIASRGIDVPHIQHVINYDLPQCTEDYIHRIGRTGRAGATGEAVSLVSERDKKKGEAICRLIDKGESQEKVATSGKYKKKKKVNGQSQYRSSRNFKNKKIKNTRKKEESKGK